MPKIRTVAVVGCGIGRSHIVEGYAPHPDKFRVAAICDLDEARLAKVADEFGIARRTTSFDELLADDDVDIIDICTPPALHFEQVARSARRRQACRLRKAAGRLARRRRPPDRGREGRARAC